MEGRLMAATKDVWTQYDQLGYYELLGIDKGATEEHIQAAYRDRIQTFHPDVCPEDRSKEAASAITSRLNAAREVLTDPTDRRQYDRLGHEAYCKQIGNADHAPDEQPSAPGAGMGAQPDGEAHAATDPEAGAEAESRSQSRSGEDARADSEPTAGASDGADATDSADASASASAGRTAASDARGGDDGAAAAGEHGDGASTRSTDTTQTHFGRDATGTGEWGGASRDQGGTAGGRRRTDEWGAAATETGTGAGAASGTATRGGGNTTASPAGTSSPGGARSWDELDGVADKIAWSIGGVIGIPYGFFLGGSLRFTALGVLAAPVAWFLAIWVAISWWSFLTKRTLVPLLHGVGALELVYFGIAEAAILVVPGMMLMFVAGASGMGLPEFTLASRGAGLFAVATWLVNLPAYTEPLWGWLPLVGSWLRSRPILQPFFNPQTGPTAAGLPLHTGAVGAGFIVIHLLVYVAMIWTLLFLYPGMMDPEVDV
ncbi:MAG: J domain-containing protein [Salinirussus sp.]